MPVSRGVRTAACVLLLAVALVACSNRSSSANRRPHSGVATASVVNGVQQVTIKAGANLRFNPSTITVHPGKVHVILVNTGGAPHNFEVTDFPADFVPLGTDGQTTQATFTAPSPGTYEFVCTIHTKQGMTGKLVVLSS
jgi:plastocyanin